MKTETKKLDKCQVQLTVKLDADEMKKIVKDVERAFVREAKLPGFRPGKVPIEMIRKEFANGLAEETKRMMYQNSISDAIKAEALDQVAVTEVKDVKYDADGGEFAAIVDVKPVFKLPSYKGLKIGSNDVTVKDEDVAAQLQRLREAYSDFVDAKEGDAAAVGDFVQIDYSGTIDGKPILEIAPEAKIVASGAGFWTQLEEGRFLKEILDAVAGMKVGESKDGVEVVFDTEAAPEPLKGAKAVYSVKLDMIRRRLVPDDAKFAEKAKVESIEKLAADMREQMQKRANEQEAARRENEAVEQLLKKCDFEVPGSQVRRATDGNIQRLAQRAQQSGLDASYFEKNREKIMKDAEESAERQVRLWYIIEAIGKAEGLDVNDDELGKKVIDLVLANAK